MNIDKRTGKTVLPSGFAFDSSLTEREFKARQFHSPTDVYDNGTPWFYYPFSGGSIESHDMRITLCFYSGELVTVSFLVRLYPDEEGNWDNFSYEKEQEEQALYARLFRGWFGAPHKTATINFLAEKYPILAESLSWKFAWGEAWCGHDQRGGGTHAMLRYTQNDQWSHQDYRSHHPV